MATWILPPMPKSISAAITCCSGYPVFDGGGTYAVCCHCQSWLKLQIDGTWIRLPIKAERNG